MKLIKSRVEAIAVPPSGQAFQWDDELRGFGVRITASGARSYVAQGRVHGQTRRVTIGTHGRWTCDEARRQAREILRQMDLGIDPQEERQRAAAMGVTLREVARAYLRDRELKPLSKRDIERHITTTFQEWADGPAGDITRDACMRLFRQVSARSPSQANQAFVILRGLLNYARAAYRAPDGTSTLPENPVAVLSEAKLWNRERARETRIPIDKVGAFWAALERLRDKVRTRDEHTCIDYVAFLLLTGARGSEAAELTWDRVELAEGATPTWHLPDPKNGRPVTFPLSTAAKALLEAARERRVTDPAKGEEGEPAASPYVFPSWGRTGHITDARGILEKLAATAGLRLTRHDLRRTFTAIAIKCGVEMWKAELLTGHVPQSVTLKHYMETSDLRYLAKDADRIGAWVVNQGRVASAMAAGKNVIALRAIGSSSKLSSCTTRQLW
jgi:integrase